MPVCGAPFTCVSLFGQCNQNYKNKMEQNIHYISSQGIRSFRRREFSFVNKFQRDFEGKLQKDFTNFERDG